MIDMAHRLIAMPRQIESETLASSPSSAQTAAVSCSQAERERLAELASAAYRERRRRVQVFGDDSLFSEPAWDILLDLFVAAQASKPVSVTSACIGSAVPTTTALRWLLALENRGLIIREHDIRDGRRSFIRLTDSGEALMMAYFRG